MSNWNSCRLALAVVCSSLLACEGNDTLLSHYLQHRNAILNRDWQWIADHLSKDFLATHSTGILAAGSPQELDGEWKSFRHQATIMRHDLTICSVNSRFKGLGEIGVLDLVVKRSNQKTQKISYSFVKNGNEWLLDSIFILSPSAAESRNLSCERPMIELAPIPDELAPLV